MLQEWNTEPIVDTSLQYRGEGHCGGDEESANDGGPTQLYEAFASRGVAALSLQPSSSAAMDNDDLFRREIESFLWQDDIWPYLQARYKLSSFSCREDTTLFPTHVTRRAVPPDGMPLVHIDYRCTKTSSCSSSDNDTGGYSFFNLVQEWKSRWSTLSGWTDGFVNHYELVGVVTLWVLLSATAGKHPLWVAQAVDHDNDRQFLRHYKVKGKNILWVYSIAVIGNGFVS